MPSTEGLKGWIWVLYYFGYPAVIGLVALSAIFFYIIKVAPEERDIATMLKERTAKFDTIIENQQELKVDHDRNTAQIEKDITALSTAQTLDDQRINSQMELIKSEVEIHRTESEKRR